MRSNEQAQHEAAGSRDQDARGYADPQRRLQVIDEQPGRIGAERSKGVLGERELAGEARQHIPNSPPGMT